MIAGLALVGLAGGCSSDDAAKPKEPAESYLGLTVPEPGKGFQVRTRGMPIPAGKDLNYCEVAEFPGEPDEIYWVSGLEFANGENSHHLVVDSVTEGTATEAALAGYEIGDPILCINVQSQFGPDMENLGNSQTPYRKLQYPPGVGRKFRGKQRFVFDYHYFNTTDEEIWARSAINFHLTEESEVRYIAQLFGFGNVTIDTPPGQRASFTAECRLNVDAKLMGLTRHTHQWGRDFDAFFAGGPRDGEKIFTSSAYDRDVDHVFDEPIDVKAGEGFRFRCEFENTETYPLRFGINASDEMCNLYGLWYSESMDAPPYQGCLTSQIGADGVARAKSASTFPRPTAEGVALCLEGAAKTELARSPECTRCSCEECAVVIGACAEDEHCNGILECVNRTNCSGADCLAVCQTEFLAHSPGAGRLAQAGECITQQCPVCTE